MVNYETLTEAVEHALANFLGTDNLDETVIELVSQRVAEHIDSPNLESFIESSSSYVQVDMDELTLNDYVGEMITQLEDYGVI